MEIEVLEDQGTVPVTVFRIKGDVTSEGDLQSRAQEAFDAGTRNLLLDLSAVPYMSSPGLRALHFIYTLLRGDSPAESDESVKAGITSGTYTAPHLKLLKPSKNVLEVLKMSGYDMFLEIYTDYKKAIASF